jgi:hypothetical protein
MKKALSVITIVLAFVVSGLAKTQKNIDPADIRLTDRTIHADVSRLTLLVVFDDSIPRVCDDNFRFCTAGCSANDGACADACVAELKQCIKSINIAELAAPEHETQAPDLSRLSAHAGLQAELLAGSQ